MSLETTRGYQIAMSFKPFISPKCTEHMEIVKDMAKSINRSYDILLEWSIKGEFTYQGLRYKRGINDHSAIKLLKTIYT